jgi:hypothetical protein
MLHQLLYSDVHGVTTQRTIFMLEWISANKMVAYCFLRNDWRHFISERICDLQPVSMSEGQRHQLITALAGYTPQTLAGETLWSQMMDNAPQVKRPDQPRQGMTPILPNLDELDRLLEQIRNLPARKIASNHAPSWPPPVTHALYRQVVTIGNAANLSRLLAAKTRQQLRELQAWIEEFDPKYKTFDVLDPDGIPMAGEDRDLHRQQYREAFKRLSHESLLCSLGF